MLPESRVNTSASLYGHSLTFPQDIPQRRQTRSTPSSPASSPQAWQVSKDHFTSQRQIQLGIEEFPKLELPQPYSGKRSHQNLPPPPNPPGSRPTRRRSESWTPRNDLAHFHVSSTSATNTLNPHAAPFIPGTPPEIQRTISHTLHTHFDENHAPLLIALYYWAKEAFIYDASGHSTPSYEIARQIYHYVSHNPHLTQHAPVFTFYINHNLYASGALEFPPLELTYELLNNYPVLNQLVLAIHLTQGNQGVRFPITQGVSWEFRERNTPLRQAVRTQNNTTRDTAQRRVLQNPNYAKFQITQETTEKATKLIQSLSRNHNTLKIEFIGAFRKDIILHIPPYIEKLIIIKATNYRNEGIIHIKFSKGHQPHTISANFPLSSKLFVEQPTPDKNTFSKELDTLQLEQQDSEHYSKQLKETTSLLFFNKHQIPLEYRYTPQIASGVLHLIQRAQLLQPNQITPLQLRIIEILPKHWINPLRELANLLMVSKTFYNLIANNNVSPINPFSSEIVDLIIQFTIGLKGEEFAQAKLFLNTLMPQEPSLHVAFILERLIQATSPIQGQPQITPNN